MPDDKNIGNLIPLNIEDELKRSFISYAMAVIVSRALPDVRDGLKPVHRRILYSMSELGVTPDKPYRKSARIVGDVLGKYHPHGDSSVYDAMVRLAQDFNIRYTLVDGQGNFGSVDGDGAAAMRYTEARLSKLAMEMLRDIDKSTVDFYPNFDETLMQPAVMPSRFPNLLVNGSSGIAVGMATNIPPHNLGEVIDGVVTLIDQPDCTVDDLMRHIHGPDFPTGGVILGRRGIYDAYHTGRGKIIVRARSTIEDISAGRQRIVVTEIPYMVNKARLIEKIADMVHEKSVEGISDIRDESDREGMRIVIDLKHGVNANVVLNTLYKHTQLQDTFGAIMLALVDGEPKILSLKSILSHYLAHQEDVITRRTRYDLEKAEARLHIVQGLLIALDYIDEVIALIRASRTAAEARVGLMERFGLSEVQAQAILDMRLQRLTGLEREKLEAERDELEKQIAYFRKVLSDEGLLKEIIKTELLEIRKKYADERRTEISALDGEIDMLDLIPEEDVVVTLTHFGYVKRLAKSTYRVQRRGGRGVVGATTREEDYVERMLITSSHAALLFFTTRGRVYRLNCYELPEGSRTSKGTAIVNLLQLDPDEKVSAMLALPPNVPPELSVVMATGNGTIKRTDLSEFANLRRTGLIAIVLREGDQMIRAELARPEDDVLLATHQGMTIRFPVTDIRSMGRNSMGVRGVNLREGDACIDLSVLRADQMGALSIEEERLPDDAEPEEEALALDEDAEDAAAPEETGLSVLCITENGYGKRSQLKDYRRQSRGGYGIKAFARTDKTGALAGQMPVSPDEDVLMITSEGVVIRTPARDIPVKGRSTQGVRMMKVAEGTRVIAIARGESEPDGEGEAEDASDASELERMEQALDARPED